YAKMMLLIEPGIERLFTWDDAKNEIRTVRVRQDRGFRWTTVGSPFYFSNLQQKTKVEIDIN
ncbi:hypothetical protein, partial [Parasutterella excrementihominis]|uniref:hypothetical protein n=1 Tax=Parasutterella excrementihominis TaxID=487175 RepID=UPI00242A9F37